MSGVLWTAKDFAAAVGGRVVGVVPDVTGISIDSRTVKPGEAFFAITGDKMDGHDFVRAALDGGAGIAVVAESRLSSLGRVKPLIVVEDVLAALTRLAVAARARAQARIIAVTGSVGKTSTKEMLRTALASAGEVHASVASFNNHWGVPLTLARMPETAQYAVFEIGMNHAGEITPLTKMVRPHIAMVTNVEAVHLEHFLSVDQIADAKAEIFLGLEPGGIAIINADSPYRDHLARVAGDAGAEILEFGSTRDADAKLLMYSVLSDRSAVTASVTGTDIAYSLGAPGKHLVQNSLAVLLAAKVAGADVKAAAAVLADFKPPAGRGQRHALHVGTGRAMLLDESYNANPASMRAAIELLGHTQAGAGRRIAVLGDMLELGAQADDMHRDLAAVLEDSKINLIFCAGPHMLALYDSLPAYRRGGWAITSEDLKDRVLDEIRPNDVVMVKGSLGSRMGPIVAALLARFAPAAA